MNFVVRFLQSCALGLFLFSIASGQSQTGSLSGTVLDSHNAAVPGATVDATLSSSGVTLHSVSSESGLYVFPSLPPGVWTVAAEKPGFKKVIRTEVEIFIAQRQTLDLQLEVGDMKQTVEVTAAKRPPSPTPRKALRKTSPQRPPDQ